MDLVMLGGTVLTRDSMNRRQEALAVRDGEIVAVGATAEIATTARPDTEVVHLVGLDIVDQAERFAKKQEGRAILS
jgi:predicted amidohydrolase YtcJ